MISLRVPADRVFRVVCSKNVQPCFKIRYTCTFSRLPATLPYTTNSSCSSIQNPILIGISHICVDFKMAEPPYKRSRRPDSKQMWDEVDSRTGPGNGSVVPSRERDNRERTRGNDERDWKKERRYRSRSPREDRGGRDRDFREARGDRDDRGARDRPRDYRSNGNANPRGRDNRDRRGDMERDRGRSMLTNTRQANGWNQDGRTPRDLSRSKSRDRESRRSRSPRKGSQRDKERVHKRDDRDHGRSSKLEERESRTATPPVSFKVGSSTHTTSHYERDHEQMDVEASSASNQHNKSKNVKTREDKVSQPDNEDEDDILVEDDGLAAMQAMMGFGGFASTQNKKVLGNDIGGVRKEKKTEYRQYMNRVGGFNRPLSPPRES